MVVAWGVEELGGTKGGVGVELGGRVSDHLVRRGLCGGAE